MQNQNPFGAAVNAQTRQPLSVQTSAVLKNTYKMLSATLMVTAVMAGLSMMLNVGYGISLMCSIAAMVILWFVLPRNAQSEAGIYTVFAVSALLGFGLGPVLNRYINGFANGSQIVMLAFGMTATIFMALSVYAVRSQRDFSAMRGMVGAGILVAVFASIGLLVASLFGINVQPLSLALSAIVALLMCAMILYNTSDIINGVETNYVLATVSLYLAIYNIFTSLLQLLGFASKDD